MRWGECLIGDGQKERILSMALVLTAYLPRSLCCLLTQPTFPCSIKLPIKLDRWTGGRAAALVDAEHGHA